MMHTLQWLTLDNGKLELWYKIENQWHKVPVVKKCLDMPTVIPGLEEPEWPEKRDFSLKYPETMSYETFTYERGYSHAIDECKHAFKEWLDKLHTPKY